MYMFSFFKNLVNKEQGQNLSEEELKKELREEAPIHLDELDEQEIEKETPVQPEAAGVSGEVSTELSLHPLWEEQLDNEKKYTLRFLQAELPKIKYGSVSVIGFSMIPQPTGGVNVALFFRNGTPAPVKFKNIRLAIYFDDTPFARQRINLSDMGTIPPFASRPWEVHFPPESFLHDNFDFKNWKVLMRANKSPYVWPNELELDPQMEARMTERQKDRLEYFTKVLPPIKADTVEITGFDIGKTKDGRLVAGLLFRNGIPFDFTPKALRITISDMEGDVVATGLVDASTVKVRPKTSRPWLVVFPAEMVKKPDADIRRWALEVTTT
jgi:SLAP domain-containing protein